MLSKAIEQTRTSAIQRIGPGYDKNIYKSFENLYKLFVGAGVLRFPSPVQITSWEKVLDRWISSASLPLFVRKPSGLRGGATQHESGRLLLVTDNTPAHWVYKKIVIDNESLTLSEVRHALTNNILPLAMLRKTSEVDLKVTQVALKEHRLGNENWKLAHINRIALPRVKHKTIQHHVTHHRMFLSLDNMYIIRKEYAGLAEVPLFNEIVVKNKAAL